MFHQQRRHQQRHRTQRVVVHFQTSTNVAGCCGRNLGYCLISLCHLYARFVEEWKPWLCRREAATPACAGLRPPVSGVASLVGRGIHEVTGLQSLRSVWTTSLQNNCCALHRVKMLQAQVKPTLRNPCTKLALWVLQLCPGSFNPCC